MYLPQWALAFKESKTEIKFIKGTYYKYEVRYQYNKDKKRTDKITVRLLGKLSETAGFVASDKNLLRQDAIHLPMVDIKTFGLYYLFSNLLSAEIISLKASFKEEVIEKLLCYAMMRWAYQSPIKRVANYHAHDFCSEHWSKESMTDKQVTATLKFMGENRQAIVSWMKAQLPVSTTKNSFVMMDSTHISSVSEHLGVNARGYNPSHDFDKQVRLMYLFAAELNQPVYYRLINGNITDIKSMSLCIKEMNVKNIVFIADKGFYSKANIEELKKDEMHYIIPLQRTNSLIDFSPLRQVDFKKKLTDYFKYQERIIWYYNYRKEEQQLVTFLDDKLRVKEESDYLLRVKSHPAQNTMDKYYEKLTRFGTLTLNYDLAESLTPQQLYEAYKQRNEIEVMFDSYKNFMDADKTFMQDRYVLEGWLMANFLAMIAYYKLFTRLKKQNLLQKYSPKDIIELSKTIYKLKVNDQWKTSEITLKVKSLFKKLEIDYLT